MDKLDELVERAAQNDPEVCRPAFEELTRLAEVPANRRALIAHPRAMPAILEQFSSGNINAARVLSELVSGDMTLLRDLYLRQGVVDCLISQYEHGTAVAFAHAAYPLMRLLSNYENKVDFVLRDGYAKRLGAVADSGELQGEIRIAACVMLSRLFGEEDVAGDGELEAIDVDALREDFFRAPRRMSYLVTAKLPEADIEEVFLILAALAKCKRLVGEILAYDGVVDFFAKCLRKQPYESTFGALAQLLGNDPPQAVAHDELVQALTQRASRVALAHHSRGGQEPEALVVDIDDDWEFFHNDNVGDVHLVNAKRDVLTFWRNVPRVWTVVSVPRLKQRSALRRLPVDMFRMLRETLCGNGGVWYLEPRKEEESASEDDDEEEEQ